jgi:hypothetical protein
MSGELLEQLKREELKAGRELNADRTKYIEGLSRT